MRSSSVVLTLACLGCTAKQPPTMDESEPAEVIPTGALVVLAEDATLYRDREDPVGVRLPPRTNGEVQGAVVEVVAAAGTRLEVRTLGAASPPTCVGSFEFADDYELRVWVEQAKLRRILVAPVTFELGDGTRLELRPGIPVIDEQRGELDVAGHSLFVNLADAQLGRAYPAPAAMELAQPRLTLRKDTPLAYGESSLVGGAAPFARASAELEKSADERLLIFDNACGRFTLRASADALVSDNAHLYAMRGPHDAIPRMARNFDPDMAKLALPADAFADSPYGGAFDVEPPDRECEAPRWTLASGVALTWADGGGPAGTVLRAHELPADARELEGRVCFEIDSLDLCADADRVGRKLDSNCRPRSDDAGSG